MKALAPGAPDGLDPGLDDDRFARLLERLGPFEHRPRLAVAVSGGPDSLALTLLLRRWLLARGGSLLGLTVDHGLRAGAAEEAATVGQWLHRLGVDHVVLRWTGDKPKSGIQAAAREARYRLLEERCRSEGILHLLLAHHENDQIETLALRDARRSGPRGLAGMAAVAERPGLRLLRPLLTVPRATLLRTLERSGHPWLDDPSNRCPGFARTGLRRVPPPAGLAHAHLAFARARAAADHRLSAWLARYARIDPLGFVGLDRRALAEAAPEDGLDILRRVLMTVGGHPYPPRSAALVRLREVLAAGARVGTLAGVRLEQDDHRLLAVREGGAIRSARLPLGCRVWFDHRFEVVSRTARNDLFVIPLGKRGWRVRRRLVEVVPCASISRRIGEGLPALESEGELAAVPQLGLVRPDVVALDDIRVRFRPRHPLAGAPHAVPGAEVVFASPHG